ncbi:hypothetical protein ALQ87_102932 [Pseudomonas savastanoi pv. glycinea]|nr:hypothetical protein ALQ87_102932 [Pseudomonas savastanoi pv. glycinea]
MSTPKLCNAERPERHTHAEHGHDSDLSDDYRSSCSKRGNAVGDALRHKSTRHRVSQKRPRSSPSEKTRKSLLSDFIISCTMTYDIGTDPVIL